MRIIYIIPYFELTKRLILAIIFLRKFFETISCGKGDFGMIEFFKYACGIASMGITVDFSTKTEVYFIGNGDIIREYAHSGMPSALPKGIMKHSNDFGNLIKDCNRLMRVKRELNEIMEIADRLCGLESFCNGECNSVLDELASYYDTSEYANVIKNYIVYLLFCSFKQQRDLFNKKVGLSVKNNHDRAEKHIEIFRNEADRIFKPFLVAREKKELSFGSSLFGYEEVTDCSVYHIRGKDKPVTLNVANNSYIAMLEIYDDILNRANKVIRNCDSCGELMITDRANASLVCSRTNCKRDYHTKINSESRRRAMAEPVQSAYIGFNEKCKSYRKKLLPFPELLEKFDERHNKYRVKLKRAKIGLTKKSDPDVIEHFDRLCNDAAEDVRELAIILKGKANLKAE